MKSKLTAMERRWILYDVGNSAFILLVSTIIPIYFKYLTGKGGISATDSMAIWGYAASFVTLIVALIGPILGTVADTKDFKKPLFKGALLLGVVGCIVLGVTNSWIWFLVVFVIAKVGYSASLIFYDSMLSDVTREGRLDLVSSMGFAWGYIGSCIPFIISLLLVLGRDKIGISMGTAMLGAFSINGVWWLCLSIPLLKSYQQIHFIEKPKKPVRESFIRLKDTFQNIRKDKPVITFLIAFFFYIDGVYTIIDMATSYGQSLGLDSSGLLMALMVTQVVAFPCALLFGRISKRMESERLITICIIAYTGIALFAIQLDTQVEFWILAICVGMFQGGIQALSRSYFTKIIPKEKSGEYFGLFDICGKGAAFLGTTLVSVGIQITGSSSGGVSILSIMFIFGLVMFRYSLRVREHSIQSEPEMPSMAVESK